MDANDNTQIGGKEVTNDGIHREVRIENMGKAQHTIPADGFCEGRMSVESHREMGGFVELLALHGGVCTDLVLQVDEARELGRELILAAEHIEEEEPDAE